MSFPKSNRFNTILLTTVCLLARHVVAVEPATPEQITVKPLTATVKTEAGFGAEAVRRIHVKTGTNELAFGLPSGFQVNITSRKIILTHTNGVCFLTLRIVTPALDTANQPGLDFYRRLAVAQYSGATISAELAGRVGNHDGPAFDLTWRNSAGGPQAARIAYIPVAAGVLEISLVTTPDKFGGDQYYYNLMVASIVTNESGKLEPATPPGNS